MQEKPYEIFVLTPLNVFSAFDAAKNNPGVEDAIRALSLTLEKILKGQRFGCLFLDCSCKFKKNNMPVAFAVAVPMFPEEDKHSAIAMGICHACFQKHDGNIEDVAMEAVRQHFPSMSTTTSQ